VIVPRREADAVLARAHERIALEQSWITNISEGRFTLVDSDEQLANMGCQFID
jgi:hypothetical protein